jgi:aspartyl-tRNA(Asn)/glutamyl-tRNA(Gln) amidotransferase subunit C
MPLGVSDVRAVAALAKLALSPAEEERLVAEFNKILGYMDKLNELDTEGVRPTSHPVPMQPVVRSDEVAPFPGRDQIMAAAPQRDGDHFRVPRVIE